MVYWIVVDATRSGSPISTYAVCDRIDALMAQVGHAPIVEAQVRQNLIWLRHDAMVVGEPSNPDHKRSEWVWKATDTTWAGRADLRWKLLYAPSSRSRYPKPGFGEQNAAECINRWPIKPNPIEVKEEAEALRRSSAKTVFGTANGKADTTDKH